MNKEPENRLLDTELMQDLFALRELSSSEADAIVEYLVLRMSRVPLPRVNLVVNELNNAKIALEPAGRMWNDLVKAIPNCRKIPFNSTKSYARETAIIASYIVIGGGRAGVEILSKIGIINKSGGHPTDYLLSEEDKMALLVSCPSNSFT